MIRKGKLHTDYLYYTVISDLNRNVWFLNPVCIKGSGTANYRSPPLKIIFRKFFLP